MLRRALLCYAFTAAIAVTSFGTGNIGKVCLSEPVQLFHHEVSSAARVGVMSHFWSTGHSEEFYASANLELRVSYAFDDESPPSISLTPAKVAGQFFGAINVSGVWHDGTMAATPGNTTLYAAGEKVGKNAHTGGWWHQLKMPFRNSVNVTLQLVPRPGSPQPHPASCATSYVQVRGYEQAASLPAVVLPSGVAVPSSARLELHSTDTVAAPGTFTRLIAVDKGRADPQGSHRVHTAGHALPAASACPPLVSPTALHCVCGTGEGLLYGIGIGLATSPPWGSEVNGKLIVQNSAPPQCQWWLERTRGRPSCARLNAG
jgi:hypothetical protein